jgi:hypothetical protein
MKTMDGKRVYLGTVKEPLTWWVEYGTHALFVRNVRTLARGSWVRDDVGGTWAVIGTIPAHVRQSCVELSNMELARV